MGGSGTWEDVGAPHPVSHVAEPTEASWRGVAGHTCMLLLSLLT